MNPGCHFQALSFVDDFVTVSHSISAGICRTKHITAVADEYALAVRELAFCLTPIIIVISPRRVSSQRA